MSTDDDITQESLAKRDYVSANESIVLSATSHALTDTGCKRIHNEDAYYSSDALHLWVVSDGMGGHNAGDYASKSVVEAIEKFSPEGSLESTTVQLDKIIQKTNLDLIAKASEINENSVIGATLALMTIKDNQGVLLWAGDSRVYRVRSGFIEQLTLDHSHVNDLIKVGKIKPEEADSHPDSNKITRAVGFKKELNLDHRKLSILANDRYIICSDGLTKELTDVDILSICSNESTESANHKLLQRALESNARDNVTSIVIDFTQTEQ